jgi:hypothetical protein
VKRGTGCCCRDFFHVSISLLDVAPAFPFIASKGRGRVTIMVRKTKKGGLERGRTPPYPVRIVPL